MIHNSLAAKVQAISIRKWNQQLHHLLIFYVFPDTVRSNNDHTIVRRNVVLRDLGNAVGASPNSSLVTEGSRHGQAGQLKISHPHSQRSDWLAAFVDLRFYSS